MKTIWSKVADDILSIGQPLNEVGIDNWALTKAQALEVLERLEEAEISILGGDIYENIDGIIQSNYDNWYCEQLPEESKSAFLSRSITKAREYIEDYQRAPSTMVYFVLVPSVD